MNLAKSLNNGQVLTASLAVFYTVPSGASTRLTQASIINTDVVNRTITINIIESGGAANVANTRIKSKTLTPNETWVPFQILGKTMATGTTIQAIADVTAVVSMDLSGIELTS